MSQFQFISPQQVDAMDSQSQNDQLMQQLALAQMLRSGQMGGQQSGQSKAGQGLGQLGGGLLNMLGGSGGGGGAAGSFWEDGAAADAISGIA